MRVSVRGNIPGLSLGGRRSTRRPASKFLGWLGERWGRVSSALSIGRTGDRSLFNFDRRRVVEQCSHGRGDGWCCSCSSVRHFPWRASVAEFHQALTLELSRVLATLAGVLILPCLAVSQTTCYVWSPEWFGATGTYATGTAACAAEALHLDATHGSDYSFSVTSATPAGAPLSSSDNLVCDFGESFQGGAATDFPDGAAAAGVAGACPASCASNVGKVFSLYVGGGTVAPAGSGMCGSDGCAYTAVNVPRMLAASDGSGHQMILQDGTATGAACSAASGPPSPQSAQPGNQTDNGVPNSTCVSQSGNIACMSQSAAGKNCGTYNGDQVCVADVPAGSCVQYASGGVACTQSTGATAASSPPAPDNGTPGQPAPPTETVTTSQGVTNYYGAATVKGSTGAAVTKGAGVGGVATGGTGGGGTGTGSSGSGPGDCMLQPGEPGADDPAGCNGTTPSLARSDTVQSNIQGLYSGIAASPIVSALAAISSSVPSAGSCPTASVTLMSLSGHTFDFLQTACTIFAADLSTLIAISDTIWCILGVLIVMSA